MKQLHFCELPFQDYSSNQPIEFESKARVQSVVPTTEDGIILLFLEDNVTEGTAIIRTFDALNIDTISQYIGKWIDIKGFAVSPLAAGENPSLSLYSIEETQYA